MWCEAQALKHPTVILFHEFRYLGTYIVGGRTFKCSTTHAKRSFHRAINAIFGKIGRLASEEVILELVKNKCMPCLLYGLECYTLPKSSLRSLDFVVVRFLMKLFKTVNNEIIRECCSNFKFALPSELLDNRMAKFQNNFMLCTGILHYFAMKI